MFDRVLYKNQARQSLKGNWSSAAIVALFLIAVVVSLGFITKNFDESSEKSFSILSAVLHGITGIAVARFFLIYSISESDTRPTFADFLEGFQHWFTGALANLWRLLWLALWFMCFVIPGFIKMVAYSQLMFILADNPNIGVRKALRLSIVITQGYKTEIFCMYLSFLGWLILGGLTAGILYVWIIPYIELTAANAYKYLKDRALESGIVSHEDFYPEIGE